MAHTILIIEDVEMNRKILMEILGSGYNYIQASNGEEALKILEKSYQIIDAVLLDIVMPIMDGYEFLSRFKRIKQYLEIPVIAMTGIESKNAEEAILEAGAIDFLEKPYKSAIIRNRLTNTLNLTSAIKNGRVDGLTGLLNRSAFRHEVEKYIENTTELAALLIIDIDNFKRINDIYGHFFGDKVLIDFANIMIDCCNSTHAVGRLGGDEFIILLKNIKNEQEAKKIASNIIGVFNKSMSQYEGEVPSCSIGISFYPKHGCTRSEIYLRADEALYNAKRLGKAKCCCYLEGQEILPRSSSTIGKEWILDVLDAYIYISDTETNRIYYANTKIASALGDLVEFDETDIAKVLGLEAKMKLINQQVHANVSVSEIVTVGDKKMVSLATHTIWGDSENAKIQLLVRVEDKDE